jgi:putative transposase
MLKAKKIRLDASRTGCCHPGVQGKRTCRGLYNWQVVRLQEGGRWYLAEEQACPVECQAYDPELNDLYPKRLAEVSFLLDKAMKAFYRRVKAREIPRFPRVQPRHQFFTLGYPAASLRFEGCRLILPTGGREQHQRLPHILARLSEVPPGSFREVAISRDARGHHRASFVYEAPEAVPEPGQVVAFESLDQVAFGRGQRTGPLLSHQRRERPSVVRTEQLDKIRSRRDRSQKRSRRSIYLSQVYRRVSEQKRAVAP